jgi:hypothetical protein
MMMGVKIVHNLIKDMAAVSTKMRSNMEFAIRRTAFAGRSDLIQKLKGNSLSLPPLKVYKNPAGRRLKKRVPSPGAPPLARLAKGIFYKMEKGTLIAEIGFLGTQESAWQKRYAEKHQLGYKIILNEKKKEKLRKAGFTIRQSTNASTVNPRDPIGIYIEANRGRMLQSIKDVYDLKMLGGRV